MSNVVQFLEALALNPKPLSAEDFVFAVVNADLDSASQQALMDRNAEALNYAVGGRLSMMCMIVPAENDEPQPDEDRDGDEDTPEREASRAA